VSSLKSMILLSGKNGRALARPFPICCELLTDLCRFGATGELQGKRAPSQCVQIQRDCTPVIPNAVGSVSVFLSSAQR
jgi:hydrogenase maturation factor